VASGTKLTTDLVNSIINRTEYAADLLRQYKLVAGNGMYVEPHFDGTRISYFQPVGGGSTPVQPLLAYKYRMLFFTPLLFLVSGGTSYTSFQIQLQRYTGTGTNADPIIPRTWKTPENYALSLNTVNNILENRVFSVTGEYVEIYSPSVLLASQNGNFNLQMFLRDASGTVLNSILRTVSYPYKPTLNITNVSFQAGLTNARLSFNYYIGPVVDFSPVQVNLSMTRNDPTTGLPVTITEAFNISPSNFFASGTYTSNATFNTLESTSPLSLIVGTYFQNNGVIQVNPN
jgi:hypothetical protein